MHKHREYCFSWYFRGFSSSLFLLFSTLSMPLRQSSPSFIRSRVFGSPCRRFFSERCLSSTKDSDDEEKNLWDLSPCGSSRSHSGAVKSLQALSEDSRSAPSCSRIAIPRFPLWCSVDMLPALNSSHVFLSSHRKAFNHNIKCVTSCVDPDKIRDEIWFTEENFEHLSGLSFYPILFVEQKSLAKYMGKLA